jgi:hypothetical protein
LQITSRLSEVDPIEKRREGVADRISGQEVKVDVTAKYTAPIRTIQTLPRRPLAASMWAIAFFLGGLLVNEAHSISPTLASVTPNVMRIGQHAFYLGWILVWISPVLGGLTWLGASGFGKGVDRWSWAIGSAWFVLVDT